MTYWFDRRAGMGPTIQAIVATEDNDPCLDETMVLVMASNAVPDWVRVPAEIGGGQRRVLRCEPDTCVKCKTGPARRFDLDGPEKYHVSECLENGCGFTWFQFPTTAAKRPEDPDPRQATPTPTEEH